jgi:hypothetical protein
MTVPPATPPGAATPLVRHAILGALATTGALLAASYVFRVKLIEFFIWKTHRLRVRIGSIARRKRGSYELHRVRLLAPPPPAGVGEREACSVRLIETKFDEGAALRSFMPAWMKPGSETAAVGVDVELHEPQAFLEFDNLELTDSNWRRLAREVASTRKAKAPKRSRDTATDATTGQKLAQTRRFALERLSVAGSAHLRVASRALNEMLLPDLVLSGGEIRLLELSRSPSAACAELERIAAQRVLTGNLASGINADTRRRLEHYARIVLSKTTEELRMRSREHLDRIEQLLRETRKTLDGFSLPSSQRDKLQKQSERLQKNLRRANEWIGGLDRPEKLASPEKKPVTEKEEPSSVPGGDAQR